MGINIPGNPSLGSISSQFFFSLFLYFFFFSANMNLTVFAGILLAVTMAKARRASLGEKTMQAAGEADEPVEAMREAAGPASLVEKIMRAADEADEPDEAKRAKRAIVSRRMSASCKDRKKCKEEKFKPVCDSRGHWFRNVCDYERSMCYFRKSGRRGTFPTFVGYCKEPNCLDEEFQQTAD